MKSSHPPATGEELIVGALLHDLGRWGQIASLLKSLPLPEGVNRQRLAQLLTNPHPPDHESLAEACLLLADSLAFGADGLQPFPESPELGKGFRQGRLISIFEEIKLLKHEFSPQSAMRYELRTLEEDPFPHSPAATESQTSEAQHWQKFLEQFAHFPGLDPQDSLHCQLPFRHYLGALSSLMENYLWCVPASGSQTLPDISLYDHSWLKAGIAQALYVYHHEQPTPISVTSEPQEASLHEAKFLLFGGDLSGIQDYIFEVNPSQSAGMAKLLRARSFYLQMLTKSVVLEVLSRLKLEAVALIMDAGGRFILLLPHLPRVKASLQEFELDLQKALLQQFKGRLCLNTCAFPASSHDLLLGQFSHTLDCFLDALEARKAQKFQSWIASAEYHPVISEASLPEQGYCQLCELHPAKTQKDGLKRCVWCEAQIEILGSRLAQTTDYPYFKLQREEGASSGQEGASSGQEVALLFGWKVQFLDKVRPCDWQATVICNRQSHQDYSFHPIAGHLPTIRESDLKQWEDRKILEKLQAENGGEQLKCKQPKTFSMLAESRDLADSQNSGKAFLGVLKADVDNLGLVFSLGLGEQRLSISRFASLSRMLNYFFSKELIKLIEKDYPDLYVIFAGGDDLFLLGPWVKLIDFAQEFREKFSQYTAGNPDLTLSAGIAIAKPKLPIKDLARWAEEGLEHSKKFKNPSKASGFQQPTKDAVTLFGDTVSWKDFNTQIERGKWFYRLLSNSKISTAFAYRLLKYGRQAKSFRQVSSPEHSHPPASQQRQTGSFRSANLLQAGLYLSHFAYDLARNFKESDPELRPLFDGKDQREFMEHLEIPLHYCLYQNRQN